MSFNPDGEWIVQWNLLKTIFELLKKFCETNELIEKTHKNNINICLIQILGNLLDYNLLD